MRPKVVARIVLLAFVAVCVAWLGFRAYAEKRRAEAPAPPPVATATGVVAAESEAVPQPAVVPATPEATAKGTQAEAAPQPAAAPATPAVARSEAAPARKVVAYYFHRTRRCPSCMKIEKLSKETIEGKFAGELKAKALEFVSLNTEEAGNEHFEKEYELVAQSLVIVDFADGKPVRWKNLEKVWELFMDEPAFAKYVDEEIRAYLEGA